jgi:hypothetical protein
MMRCYNQQHRFYCGVDLHARTMYVCLLDQDGAILCHQNLPAVVDAFRRARRGRRAPLCPTPSAWIGVACRGRALNTDVR